jgi:hypothetical protein
VYALKYVCAPCRKEHLGKVYPPADTVTHLAVYEVRPPISPVFDPLIHDQFVRDTFLVNQLEQEYLFVPSTKVGVVTVSVDPEPIGLRSVPLRLRPNPMSGAGQIEFTLATRGEAELVLFGIDGRKIRTLKRGVFEAGIQRAIWDGVDDQGHRVASGLYFVRLRTSQGEFTRTLVYLK